MCAETLYSKTYHLNSCQTSRVDICVLFFVPCIRGQKLSARLFAQTGHECRRQCQLLAVGDCQEVIYKATRPEYFFSSNNTALSRFFSTSRTSDVAPNFAMAHWQILPLMNPLTSESGNRAHKQSSLDSKPCTPCRHSTTFPISSSCSRVAFVSRSCPVGSAEFCKIWPPGVHPGLFSQFQIRHDQIFLRFGSFESVSLSTLNTMNVRNCTR